MSMVMAEKRGGSEKGGEGELREGGTLARKRAKTGGRQRMGLPACAPEGPPVRGELNYKYGAIEKWLGPGI